MSLFSLWSWAPGARPRCSQSFSCTASSGSPRTDLQSPGRSHPPIRRSRPSCTFSSTSSRRDRGPGIRRQQCPWREKASSAPPQHPHGGRVGIHPAWRPGRTPPMAHTAMGRGSQQLIKDRRGRGEGAHSTHTFAPARRDACAIFDPQPPPAAADEALEVESWLRTSPARPLPPSPPSPPGRLLHAVRFLLFPKGGGGGGQGPRPQGPKAWAKAWAKAQGGASSGGAEGIFFFQNVKIQWRHAPVGPHHGPPSRAPGFGGNGWGDGGAGGARGGPSGLEAPSTGEGGGAFGLAIAEEEGRGCRWRKK